MKVSLKTLLPLACLSLLPATLLGQLGSLSPIDAQTHTTVAGRVMTLQGTPLAHAAVELYTPASVRVLDTDKRGEFQSDYDFLNAQNATDFTVTLRATRKGFQDAHKIVVIGGNSKLVMVPITLRPSVFDSTVLPQAELVKALSSRLRQLGTADGLSVKEEKDYARGVQEFLDRNHLEKAVPYLAKVVKVDPSCLRCRTMLALAELSWGDWDNANAELGESVNATVRDKTLGRPEPLVAYGTLLSWQHQASKSARYFLEALSYSPRDALALQELGRAQCLDLDWELAAETLAKALGVGAGPEARFLHAQALLWAGTAQQARDELDRYLAGQDIKKMPQYVRALSDKIEEKKKDAAAYVAAYSKLKAQGVEPLDYLTHPPKTMGDFDSSTDQLPLAAILSSVGHSIAELYQNLPNTSSLERLHEEILSKKGKTGPTLDQKFRYLCLMPTMAWGPTVDEYRADSTGHIATPRGVRENFMVTAGFVAAPLIFHPLYQEGSSFRYWGLANVNGTSTHVVAFAQQPSRARICGSIRVGATSKMTYLQGLAWIDANTYQIVRLVSDLLTPMPQVKLDKETTEIEFSEVQFSSIHQKFWLPEQVTVTLDWSGQTFRNTHQYSDFLVFNVREAQKIGTPKKAASLTPSKEDAP